MKMPSSQADNIHSAQPNLTARLGVIFEGAKVTTHRIQYPPFPGQREYRIALNPSYTMYATIDKFARKKWSRPDNGIHAAYWDDVRCTLNLRFEPGREEEALQVLKDKAAPFMQLCQVNQQPFMQNLREANRGR